MFDIFQKEAISLNDEHFVSNTVLSIYVLSHQILITILGESFYRSFILEVRKLKLELPGNEATQLWQSWESSQCNLTANFLTSRLPAFICRINDSN